jgi:hypothetical protein
MKITPACGLNPANENTTINAQDETVTERFTDELLTSVLEKNKQESRRYSGVSHSNAALFQASGVA